MSQLNIECNIIGPMGKEIISDHNTSSSIILLVFPTTLPTTCTLLLKPTFTQSYNKLGNIPNRYTIKAINFLLPLDCIIENSVKIYLLENLTVDGIEIIEWYNQNNEKIEEVEKIIFSLLNNYIKPVGTFVPLFNDHKNGLEVQTDDVSMSSDSSGLDSAPGWLANNCVLS